MSGIEQDIRKIIRHTDFRFEQRTSHIIFIVILYWREAVAE